MPPEIAAPDTRDAVWHAILTASASVVCLIAAETLGLAHSNMAVWTTYMVMSQYAFTSFQKGVERAVGRGLGILAGLVLITCFNDAALVTLVLITLLLTIFFYFYFAGRLAYTFLNAGLYVVAMFQIGHADPASAVWEGEALFGAIVLGVVVATLVTWLSGAERDLAINVGNNPLWPIHAEWLSQSLMLAVTVLLVMLGARVISLPPEKSAISVMLLIVTPHVQAMVHKGELRIAGAVLASAWAVGTFLLVGFVPSFLLLAALLFLGQFLATYLTRTAGENSYAGVQMGLVLPMLIVAPRNEFGSIEPAVQRLEGILLGLTASVLVAGLWPRFPVTAPPPPPPAAPGEMDV